MPGTTFIGRSYRLYLAYKAGLLIFTYCDSCATQDMILCKEFHFRNL